MRIHLVGGANEYNQWRRKVVQAFPEGRYPEVEFTDPFSCNPYLPPPPLNETAWAYTPRDLFLCRETDILFAYIDQDNPGLIGTVAEIAYTVGYGNGTYTILVLERNNHYIKDRYLDFIRPMVDIDFEHLEDGIAHLKTVVVASKGVNERCYRDAFSCLDLA